jgi:hypothetical protein
MFLWFGGRTVTGVTSVTRLELQLFIGDAPVVGNVTDPVRSVTVV